MSRKRATTYGIYVKFRRSRLTLIRGLRDPAEAVAYAAQIRKNRLHDPESVIVVREPGGEILDEATLLQAATDATAAPGAPRGRSPNGSEPPTTGEGGDDATEQGTPPPEAATAPLSRRLNEALNAAPPALATVLHLRETLDAFEQLSRARARLHACLAHLTDDLPEHPELAEQLRRLALVGRELTAQSAEGEQRFATTLVLVEDGLAREGPRALTGAQPASAQEAEPSPDVSDSPPGKRQDT